jgi:general nucleoside transport system permease protein
MSALRRFREPALVVAIAISGLWITFNLIAFAFAEAPLATLARAFAGTWGTPYGFGQVLFKATPLIFTGYAFHVAQRAGLFNIGIEGQLALASLCGAAFAGALPAGMPAAAALPLSLFVGAAVGALVALTPAMMRARLGVHEVISGIMMNRIADVLLPFTLATVLGATALRTADVAPGATLLRLDRIFPSLAGSASSIAFPIAIVLVVALHLWLARSRAGREITWIGVNPEACRAEGIDVRGRLVLAMLVSGAFAGLGMSATVLGYKGYFEIGLGSGAGFAGIAVALLGCGHPAGVVVAAVFFGTLEQAGLAINARVPKEAMTVLEAVAIVLVSAASRFAKATESERPEIPDEPAPGSPAVAAPAAGSPAEEASS